jgi:hypothetical protein
MAHEPLDGINRVFRIRYRLPLGYLADQPFSRFGNGYDRRGRAASLLVRDYDGFSTLHDRNYGVCRSQVDSYDFAHCVLPPSTP